MRGVSNPVCRLYITFFRAFGYFFVPLIFNPQVHNQQAAHGRERGGAGDPARRVGCFFVPLKFKP